MSPASYVQCRISCIQQLLRRSGRVISCRVCQTCGKGCCCRVRFRAAQRVEPSHHQTADVVVEFNHCSGLPCSGPSWSETAVPHPQGQPTAGVELNGQGLKDWERQVVAGTESWRFLGTRGAKLGLWAACSGAQPSPPDKCNVKSTKAASSRCRPVSAKYLHDSFHTEHSFEPLQSARKQVPRLTKPPSAWPRLFQARHCGSQDLGDGKDGKSDARWPLAH